MSNLNRPGNNLARGTAAVVTAGALILLGNQCDTSPQMQLPKGAENVSADTRRQLECIQEMAGVLCNPLEANAGFVKKVCPDLYEKVMTAIDERRDQIDQRDRLLESDDAATLNQAKQIAATIRARSEAVTLRPQVRITASDAGYSVLQREASQLLPHLKFKCTQPRGYKQPILESYFERAKTNPPRNHQVARRNY